MSMDYCFKCMEKLADGRCPDCGNMNIEQNQHHLTPGTILKEKYLIGAAIGAGGFGITYIGRDLVLDIRIAIKEYYPNQFSVRNSSVSSDVTITAGKNGYDKSKERFLDEARTLARFDKDAGIVKVREFFEANNTAYIVMEYVDGLTLKEYLELHGNFKADDIITKMRPVMESLARVHDKGLIHRDISPDNIKIPTEGNLKLLDFGAARFVSADLDKTVTSMTKAGYAPPEQYFSDGSSQGAWTDVYALCATIYKCITGVTPIDAPQRLNNKNLNKEDIKKPSELGAVISPRDEAVILRGMAVMTSNRYQNMTELLADFDPRPKEDIGGGQRSGGEKVVTEPPNPDNPSDNPPPPKKDKPKRKKKIKDEPIHKSNNDSKKTAPKKALKMTGIIAVVITVVVIGMLSIGALIDRANKIVIAGDKYDLSDVTVVVEGKTITPEDLDQIAKMTSLLSLKLVDCGLTSEALEVISTLENLTTLILSYNPGITNFSALSNLRKLTRLELDETGIQDISFISELTNLRILQINDCNVSDISPIANCGSLTWLSLNGNQITDLSPMERLLKLTHVNLGRNQIRSIAGMGNCAVLEMINLSDNEISDIDILAKSAETLKSVNVSNNPLNITTFENVFGNCPVLETISADNVGLVGMCDISYLPNIKLLSLAENDLGAFVLPKGTGTKLEVLNLSGNENLIMLKVEEATEWKRIDVSNTALETSNLSISASSYYNGSLILANCAAVDLQYIPTDMSYNILDIRSDTVYNAAFISQFSGSEINVRYNADINSFNTNALSDSNFYKINIYDAPLDMQEKIKNALQTKSVNFATGGDVTQIEIDSPIFENYQEIMKSFESLEIVLPTIEPYTPSSP